MMLTNWPFELCTAIQPGIPVRLLATALRDQHAAWDARLVVKIYPIPSDMCLWFERSLGLLLLPIGIPHIQHLVFVVTLVFFLDYRMLFAASTAFHGCSSVSFDDWASVWPLCTLMT